MENLKLCQKLVEKGQQMGADEIEVFFNKLRKIEVVWEKNDLQVPKTDDYRGIGIRVIKNGGMGFASTNVLNEEELVETIKRAIEIASVSPPDDNNYLPEKKELSFIPGLVDKDNLDITLPRAVEAGKTFVQGFKNYDSRGTLDTAYFKANITGRAIATSRGITAEEEKTVFESVAMGFARDGSRVSSFDIAFLNSCKMENLDLAAEGEELAQKVVGALDAVTIPGFKGTVILAPFSALDIIGIPLSFAFNAENVLNGLTPWKEPGVKIASNILEITDNAQLPGEVGSRSFDREGVPPQKINLVKEGVLESFLHNSYTARRMGQKLTGHASGSDREQPSIAPTNFIIKPGERSVQEIIRDVNRGILVNRFSGNVDPVSGDFSGVAKGGQYIENGSIVKPVKEVMIAGNVYKLLQQIFAISSEYKNLMGFNLPYIALEGVSITGK